MTDGTYVEAEYDELAYPSQPFPYCQPSRMAAMARLMGVESPLIAGARILELGCASGGNIIPLAARYPDAKFVGVDLSRRHIEAGLALVRQLGLKNVDLRQGDLARVEFEADSYDFIICHGVYSWVPENVREGILRIFAKSLSANGIAAVSYNVLPGWHYKRITRDICRHYGGDTGTPEERAGRARVGVSRLVEGMSTDTPYATFLKKEAQTFDGWPDSYICAEFLADPNSPYLFKDFVTQVGQFGLDYLSDGDLWSSFVSGATEAKVRKLAQGDAFRFQQDTDFFTGRTFRRSLLVRRGRLASFPSGPVLGSLSDLHFAADLRMQPASGVATGPRFVDRMGQAFTPSDARTGALYAELADAYPSTRSLADLVGGADGSAANWALDALLEALKAGRATTDVAPLRVGRAGPMPRVWDVARAQASAGVDFVACQNHEVVMTDSLMRLLLKNMDGNRGRGSLCDALARAVGGGELPAVAAQLNTPAAIEREIDSAIEFAARSALLEP